ncbi:MAG: SH3 domain-containing protein [Chloroflexi bacterium]|nr:MAG: SH3 domain-containing protein [Chloroflexota bacterium]
MKTESQLELRLRAHLAALGEAIQPPAGLETRVLRRLRESSARAYPGVLRQLLAATALVLLTAGLAFGIARLRTVSGPVGPTPTAGPSASVTVAPSPTAAPIGPPRLVTASEYGDMVAAGSPGAEGQMRIPDCGSGEPSPGHDCFQAMGGSEALVGTSAGYFQGARLGAGCWVYLYKDGTGWHYLDVRCAQAVGTLPRVGTDDDVHVSGCANVRAEPALAARIVACLPNGTVVHVGGGPAYRDGTLWWYLQDRGWMAHDSLVE